MNAPDKLARWNALVASHRETLGEVIAIAEAHAWARAVDRRSVRASFQILRTLAATATIALRELNREAKNPDLGAVYNSIGTWGPNGHGPRIEGLLRSAQFHAQALAGERKAA